MLRSWVYLILYSTTMEVPTQRLPGRTFPGRPCTVLQGNFRLPFHFCSPAAFISHIDLIEGSIVSESSKVTDTAGQTDQPRNFTDCRCAKRGDFAFCRGIQKSSRRRLLLISSLPLFLIACLAYL